MSDEPPEVKMLQPKHLHEFQKKHRRIWWVLIRTRESMHIVRSLSKFPFPKFVDPQEIGMFWRFLAQNCGDSVVIALHSLVNDGGADALNLRRFANSVCTWLRPEHAERYQKQLRAAKFDTKLNAISKKVSELRDKHVAHILAPTNHAKMPRVSEEESERLYVAIEKLFRVASLGSEYATDLQSYRFGGPGPRAMDRVLDLVAKDSGYINEPELRTEAWLYSRKRMSEAELEELNRWRAKFGMCEV